MALKTRDELNDQEASRYLEGALRTETSLNRAAGLLKARLVQPDLTLDEEKLINVKRMDIIAKRVKVSAKITAFLANERKINPPTKSQFEKIKRVADTIDNMVANAVRAKGIINASTELLKLWNQTTRA